MLTRIRSLNSAALVIAVIALFLALSGGAYAAKQTLFSGKDIRNESILSQDIRNGHVQREDLAKNVQSQLDERATNGQDGAAGTNGKDGVTGPQGANGADGASGPQGETGPKGEAGDTGAQGETGDTGAQGETGPTGETGAQGVDGPAGPKGDNGISTVVWSQPVNEVLTAFNSSSATDVAYANVNLTPGAAALALNGTVMVQLTDNPPYAAGMVSCNFAMDGVDMPGNGGEAYFQPSMTITYGVTVPVVSFLDDDSGFTGAHIITLRCKSTGTKMGNFGAHFTATYANKAETQVG